MFMSSQPQMYRARRIGRLVKSISVTDGSSIKRQRTLGTAMLDRLDPFLLFEDYRFDGRDDTFAPHDLPHRGFEIIAHDMTGKGPSLWLTAGRGALHADVPDPANGPSQGFQLWLNLPAAEKMQAPARRAIEPADIPAVIFATAEVRVLAGQYHGLKGPIDSPTTQPFLADILLKPDGEVTLDIPEDHQGFVYVFDGGPVGVEQTMINAGYAGLLEGGNILTLVAGARGARVLVATARPLKEPVARHGPFIMTTSQELNQAFTDYQNGLF